MSATDYVLRAEALGKKYCKEFRRGVTYLGFDLLRSAIGLGAKASLREKEFWALSNLSFEIRAGECLGVIGANGAGKSTLLKILAGIVEPTQGRVEIRGRSAALIELGAGFHPDLTGRENIYLGGGVLGLKRHEIASRFDEIVAFADLGTFIDSPVRFYSTGMYMRLGFAVAAHCNPNLLLIDEVLAVGDSAFFVKCLNRLSVLKGQGTAIVAVSHDEIAMRRVCNKCLLLKNGNVECLATPHEAYQRYQAIAQTTPISSLNESGDGLIRVARVEAPESAVTGDPLEVLVHYEVPKGSIEGAHFELNAFNAQEELVAIFGTLSLGKRLPTLQGRGLLRIGFPSVHLTPGAYRLAGGFVAADGLGIHNWSASLSRLVVSSPLPLQGKCWQPAEFKIEGSPC